MLRIEVACADRDQLGEGPLWDVDEQRLYWIDSYGPAIRRMEPNGAKKTWPVPEPTGSLSFAAAAARSRSAADSLRLILVPARPSGAAKAPSRSSDRSRQRRSRGDLCRRSRGCVRPGSSTVHWSR
jgi:sugar lactone lactonase YvrE